MDLIYMGNGPFAVPALKALKQRHRILQVIARPDRPQGKRQRIEPGPVAAAALELGLPLRQPPTVNDDTERSQLSELGAELMVVADYGELLSRETLACTTRGGINLHGSLLPKYRGAAPIVRAIADGEQETGVSVITMTPRMDAGDVVLQGRLPIGPNATAEEIEPRLAELAAELAVECIEQMVAGTLVSIPQDPSRVTKAPKLKKEDGRIDWSRSAQAIHNQVRAMIPWPVAFTFVNPEKPACKPVRIRISKTAVRLAAAASPAPGAIVSTDHGVIEVATGEGILAIEKLQPEGKKVLNASEAVHGRLVSVGDRFGNFDSMA